MGVPDAVVNGVSEGEKDEGGIDGDVGLNAEPVAGSFDEVLRPGCGAAVSVKSDGKAEEEPPPQLGTARILLPMPGVDELGRQVVLSTALQWSWLKAMARDADLQELAQTTLVTAVFAFLLFKLVSMVMAIRESVKEGKLRAEFGRSKDDRADSCDKLEGPSSIPGESAQVSTESWAPESEEPLEGEEYSEGRALKQDDEAGPLVGQRNEEVSEAFEWESVESSELDEMFGAASSFVATQASGLKAHSDVLLQLYGLYKVATEGPCKTSQPSPLKMAARAKWNAWQKLGDMSPEEAMERYVKVVSEISPQWTEATSKKGKASDGSSKKGGMGPVFSTLVADDGEERGMDALHIAAREGNEQQLVELLDGGVQVDVRDSDGGTALHWASDRGQLRLVEILIARGADIHAKDKEGQTALHVATINEQEDVAKYLVKNGADVGVKDKDGETALSLRPPGWPWMLSE